MTFQDIIDQARKTVGKTDDYTESLAEIYLSARWKQIYDSFDWQAARSTSSYLYNSFTSLLLDVSAYDKIISVKFDDRFLDPATETYIFESHPEFIGNTGDAQFYVQRWIAGQGRALKFYPLPPNNGSEAGFDHTINVLGKIPWPGSAELTDSPSIPNVEQALIAYVISDLWEFLRQLGKSQAKRVEADALLKEAQAEDTPPSPKPRTSGPLSIDGSTMAEMLDAACDILGTWEPDIRESLRGYIRRDWRTLWDMMLWTDSTVLATAPVDTRQAKIVLPRCFDKVIAVRTNIEGALTQVTDLRNTELSYYFGVDKDVFERQGEPVSYSLLPSVAVDTLPPVREQLQFSSDANQGGGEPMPHLRNNNNPDAGVEVFLKGSRNDILTLPEFTEKLTLVAVQGSPGPTDDNDGWVTSANFYDIPLTITKPDTVGNLLVRGYTSGVLLMTLGPKEHDRKNIFLQILPNLSNLGAVSDAGSVLVLGKQVMSPLWDDSDSPQLKGVANILIASAASKMLLKMGKADMAQDYKTQAQSLIQILIKSQTEQATYRPMVVP